MDHENWLSRWGYIFEIAVKRGILFYLLDKKFIKINHPALQDWQTVRIGTLSHQLIEDKKVIDENLRRQINDYIDHLLIMGYGLGWTTIRTWLDYIGQKLSEQEKKKPIVIESLWTPLSLKGKKPLTHAEKQVLAEQFSQLMGKIPRPTPEWTDKGQAANADFFLQVRLPDQQETTHLLCLEFSLNTSSELTDYRREQAHLDEIKQHVKVVESRSIFSQVNAEVAGHHFKLSHGILSHMDVFFNQKNKSFIKLCQASSYLSSLIDLLRNRQRISRPLHTHVLAVTNQGLEGMNAVFTPYETENDSKSRLMQKLGSLYREKLDRPDEEIQAKIRQVFEKIRRSLPKNFQTEVKKKLGDTPETGREIYLSLSESIENFINPIKAVSYKEALDWINEDSSLVEYFKGSPRQAIDKFLQETSPSHQLQSTHLRQLHHAAIRTAIRHAKVGKLTVIALEGNPGIGKTYAMLEAIQEMQKGFLFIYISPRVAINDKVVTALAKNKEIMALTCNAILNQGAEVWYKKHQKEYCHTDLKTIQGAVVHNCPHRFNTPKTGLLYLTSEQGQAIDERYYSKKFNKRQLDIYTNQVKPRTHPGVLRTLGTACRYALGENKHLNKVVLSLSIQGYKESNGQSTVDHFMEELFANKPRTVRGDQERKDFAKNFSNIIVMIDEIAGDSAGAPLVHAFAKQLHQQFIQPFTEHQEPSPFEKLILVVADASLSNEVVMASYLSDDSQSPPKVMVSEGQTRPYCFRMCHNTLSLAQREMPTLHIMANSFPAQALTIDYIVCLSPLKLQKKPDGTWQRPREAIRGQVGTIKNIIEQIFIALKTTEPAHQVIFFAQDKAFLRNLEQILVDDRQLKKLEVYPGRPDFLTKDKIALFDQSVHPRKRRELMKSENRDSKKLWLMTSSGARGVDFPQATKIIALVPRFAIEAGFMEIAQLIYRGRGETGDNYDRHLVLLIHDVVFFQEEESLEAQTWLRKSVDILALLLLLRATILTRIQGDAGLPHQSLAIVPVGNIAVEKVVYTLSQSLGEFLKEASLFIGDKQTPSELKGLAENAIQCSKIAFNEFDMIARVKPKNFQGSITQSSLISQAFSQITQATSPLIHLETPFKIPDYLHGVGTVWFEDWSSKEVREEVHQKFWERNFIEAVKKLNSILYQLTQHPSIPPRLNRPAHDLKEVLHSEVLYKEESQQALTQTIFKPLTTGNVWTTWAVDYPRFYRHPRSDSEPIPSLQESLEWHNTLMAIISLYHSPVAIHPVLPAYKAEPFFNGVMSDSPMNFKQVIDERYFLATREWNLLNMLLFS